MPSIYGGADHMRCHICGMQHDPSATHLCLPLKDPNFHILTEADSYADLRRVLDQALDQAMSGKGRERHASDRPFQKQPMMEIGRMVGPGFCFGQAMKKVQEASRMQPEAAKRELLGAINYLAGAYLLLEENGPT